MSRKKHRTGNTNWQIFAAPLAIGLVSIVGLVAALLGDGVYDLMSWIGLGVPVLVIAWALQFRRA